MQYLEKFQGVKFQEPVWFKAGAVILNEPLNYLGQDNLVGARSIIATLAVQVSASLLSPVVGLRAGLNTEHTWAASCNSMSFMSSKWSG